MKPLTNNEDAVSVNVEYILLSIIFIGFFIIVLLSAEDLLIQGPKDVVINEQVRDIGNMMSNTITNMYLIAPENGKIETTYRIPAEIGRETYAINADLAYVDQIIEVESLTSSNTISVTINGIAHTIPINGTAYSSASSHKISYDSR